MVRKQRTDRGLVYSTDMGRMCPECRRPTEQCRCKQKAASKSVGGGTVRVGRQTKGRKGKGVTVVTGLPLGQGELEKLIHSGELWTVADDGSVSRESA